MLEVAERLVQTRGFNAFSYADIAAAIGVRKASLHHHFATKAELGLALVRRYREGFSAALAAIEAAEPAAAGRLERYVALYGEVLHRDRMCLCGMFAADVATLPKALRTGLAQYFEANEAWLARILEEGRRRRELAFEGSAQSMAAFVVATLEGAMLVARGSGQPAEFDRAAQRLLELIPAAANRGRQPRPSRRTRPADG